MLFRSLHYADIETMYAAVGNGHISAQMVVEKITAGLNIDTDEALEPVLHTFIPKNSQIVENSRRGNSGVDVEGVEDIYVKLAKCCAPVPGDEIVGFITRGSGVSVHRSDCVNLHDLQIHQSDRIVGVKWSIGAKTLFLVNIQVEALDRAKLLQIGRAHV